MASASYTDVTTYQAYVETLARELFSEMFIVAKTMSMVTAYEGVKGRKVLTEMVVGDLIKRYHKDFNPSPDVLEFKPRVLNVVDSKVDLRVVPKDLEESYMGALRQKGQNPMDYPIQRFVIDKIIKKMQAEMEVGIWSSVDNGGSALTDLLAVLFDGYLEIIRDAITATDITPVVTGAVTNTNAVASVEAVWANLSNAYKGMPVDIFMSHQGLVNYKQDYRERYGKFTGEKMAGTNSYQLDFAQAWIHGMDGITNDNVIVITPRTNLVWGYDAATDATLINFEQEDRSLKMWVDFKIGAQIAIVRDGVLACNDQL